MSGKMPDGPTGKMPVLRQSSPHYVDRKNPRLVTCQQVIDEIADDGVGLVTQLRHDATDQNSGPAMPLQINHTVKFARTVNFCPAVRTPGPEMFGWNELEF